MLLLLLCLPTPLALVCVWGGEYDHPAFGIDLFVLSWARVRRLRREGLSSELLMCGGGVSSILLLPLVARCLERIDVCIWRMCFYVCCSDCVGICGNV